MNQRIKNKTEKRLSFVEKQKKLARTLVNARIAKDLTQEDLAKASGLTQPMIAQLESGSFFRKGPSVGTLESLGRALGLTISDLWGDS